MIQLFNETIKIVCLKCDRIVKSEEKCKCSNCGNEDLTTYYEGDLE